MGWLARLIARQIWWAMLWIMRRPGIKRFRREGPSWFSEERKADFRASVYRQDALARRYGLPLLTFCTFLLILSALATGIYFWALGAYESGLFRPPESP